MNWVTVCSFTDYSKCTAVMGMLLILWGAGLCMYKEVGIWKPLYFLLSHAVNLTML